MKYSYFHFWMLHLSVTRFPGSCIDYLEPKTLTRRSSSKGKVYASSAQTILWLVILNCRMYLLIKQECTWGFQKGLLHLDKSTLKGNTVDTISFSPILGKEESLNLLQAIQRQRGGEVLPQRHTYTPAPLPSMSALLSREGLGKEEHLPPEVLLCCTASSKDRWRWEQRH